MRPNVSNYALDKAGRLGVYIVYASKNKFMCIPITEFEGTIVEFSERVCCPGAFCIKKNRDSFNESKEEAQLFEREKKTLDLFDYLTKV